MRLTTQVVERFKGGQMEIRNLNESCVYRGKIETIVVENNELRVKFAWLAKGEGFPPIVQKWINDDCLDCEVSLDTYLVRDSASSGHDTSGDSRICLSSSSIFIDEIVELFPPNGSMLDPANVEGLRLA